MQETETATAVRTATTTARAKDLSNILDPITITTEDGNSNNHTTATIRMTRIIAMEAVAAAVPTMIIWDAEEEEDHHRHYHHTAIIIRMTDTDHPHPTCSIRTIHHIRIRNTT